MDKYVIGIDFGSTTGKLVLVNVNNGDEINSCAIKYKHQNLSNSLSVSDPNVVIHHPQDYLDVLYEGIPLLLNIKNVKSEQIIGIGIDATTSSVLPTTKTGTPLCFFEEFSNNYNSYIKLWKDHSSQNEADLLNDILKNSKEYVGEISAEWLVSKALHIFLNDRNLYKKMDRYIEVGDWIVWVLSGIESRSTMHASFTYLWNAKKGYLYKDSFKKIHEEFANFSSEKLSLNLQPPTQKVGFLRKEMAERLGLTENVAIAASNIDAIATLPSAGVIGKGKLLSILGTSSCHITLSPLDKIIFDTQQVPNCIIENHNTYISSQIAVGDCFNWFYNNLVPYHYYLESAKNNQDIYEYLEEKIHYIYPDEFNLVALDWFNGLRTNSNYRGLISGLSINTKPEEIYLSLLESTAFGLRHIIECYENNDIQIDEIVVAGGVAHNNSIILQLYADITKKNIRRSKSVNATAHGSSIFAAVAAGFESGGYDNIFEATLKMASTEDFCYIPRPDYELFYEERYEKYKELKNAFSDNLR